GAGGPTETGPGAPKPGQRPARPGPLATGRSLLPAGAGAVDAVHPARAQLGAIAAHPGPASASTTASRSARRWSATLHNQTVDFVLHDRDFATSSPEHLAYAH